MVRDDPFGLSEDRGRTRIRLAEPPRHAPQSGAVAPLQPRAAPEPAGQRLRRRCSNSRRNSKTPPPPGDPETLRTRLLDEPRHAPATPRWPAACRSARADAGAWVVAALLDDLALNTPWGGASAWPRQPLVVMLHGDVDAGAQFFARLEELERHPNRDRELLELHYLCLALGFRGKYRVPGRAGDRSLNAVRAAAATLPARSRRRRARRSRRTGRA